MQIVLLIIVVLVLIGVVMYNSLIAKKNQVDNIFAGVDAVLKKRFDLIPNLVASLERYMEHEKSIFENVTALRAQAMHPHISEDQKIALDGQLSAALGSLNPRDGSLSSTPSQRECDATATGIKRSGRANLRCPSCLQPSGDRF